MRVVIAAAIIILWVFLGALAVQAGDGSAGYTPRGYRYDSKTCSAGFQPCMETRLRTGWQNAAASSYCSQACGVFPPQFVYDRHSSGNW